MSVRFPVTITLILANLAAFAFELTRTGSSLLVGSAGIAGLMNAGALVPVLVFREHQYWRLVSGGFLHGSVMHLLVNMYSLFALGAFVELLMGSRRTAVIYGFSLVGSALAIVVWGSSFGVTVGASGAIFGLFGALFAMGLKLGARGMRLVQDNLPVLLLNLVMTFAVPGISRLGHVGGLVIGFVLTYAIFNPPATPHASA